MKRQLIAPIAALLMLGAGAATAGAESGTPEPGRMFLSWHAPYGKPGATADLTIAPGDTTEQDTLYLTCLSPVDVPRFIAMMALFTIRPATGDTLAPYWQSGHERTLTHVAVQPTPDTGKPYPVPWRKGAMNGAKYTGSAVKGNLAVVIAVGSADAESLRAGVPYVLARLIFPHPATGLAGSSQPVCVEWSKVTLNSRINPDVVIERGDRFASWNSPGCAVCGVHRGALAPAPWRPGPRP